MLLALRAFSVVALAGAVTAQVFRLQPVQDTTAEAFSAATNFGADPDVRLGSRITSFPWLIHLRGFFAFDLTGLSGLGMPVRASLHWFQAGTQQSGPPREVAAMRVLGPWTETTLTWNTMPPNDTVVYSTNFVGTGTPIGWMAWDVTPLVRDWLAGAVPNHGIVLRHPTELNFSVTAGVGPSREHVTTALRPHLEVDYGTTIGSGCTPAGALPLLGFAGGTAGPGGSFSLAAANLTSGALPIFTLGLSSTTWRGGGLPFSLAPFGFPNCDLLVADDAVSFLAPLASATLAVTLQIPGNQALRGLVLYAQVGALDASGLRLTNGFGLTLH